MHICLVGVPSFGTAPVPIFLLFALYKVELYLPPSLRFATRRIST